MSFTISPPTQMRGEMIRSSNEMRGRRKMGGRMRRVQINTMISVRVGERRGEGVESMNKINRTVKG